VSLTRKTIESLVYGLRYKGSDELTLYTHLLSLYKLKVLFALILSFDKAVLLQLIVAHLSTSLICPVHPNRLNAVLRASA
jgi:hypothetical protein